MPNPLIHLKQINKSFRFRRNSLHALVDINLAIHKGDTLGIVGESGCGKSTLGRIALGLDTPSSGNVLFDGKEMVSLDCRARHSLRQKMQLIFQDPYASLNPRMTVEEIVGEGIDIHRLSTGPIRLERIKELLGQVSLETSALHRYPHEFSGGQRQRIGIARALAVDPLFLVCDEPLSALDACTQQQVMQLLLDLKHAKQLTYLFISHDLHAMQAIADSVAVMYLGHIIEQAPTQRLFAAPLHPYTQALISAIPIPDPIQEKKRSRIVLPGEPPSPINPPKGCPFHTRCPLAMPICKTTPPPLIQITPNHQVACHLHQSN